MHIMINDCYTVIRWTTRGMAWNAKGEAPVEWPQSEGRDRTEG